MKRLQLFGKSYKRQGHSDQRLKKQTPRGQAPSAFKEYILYWNSIKAMYFLSRPPKSAIRISPPGWWRRKERIGLAGLD
jgi:hypothetical protein